MPHKRRPSITEHNDPRSDLSWYYTQSESEMGLKSSMASMLNRIEIGAEGGRRVQTDEGMIGRIVSTARHREIHQRLMRVPVRLRKVLEAAYEPRQYPVALTLFFQDAAGVVLALPMARRAYREAKALHKSQTMADWLCSAVVSGSKSERGVIDVLRERASRLLQDAFTAYANTR